MTAPDTAEAVLESLQKLLLLRRSADPASSYVASLHAKGLDAILKKLGEEAAETLIAAKNENRDALVHELADLWFHALVLMAAKDIPLSAVISELQRRMGRSGLEEKAARTSAP
jgi:phosphoribosyl-ATP pyrophosphohydrolase